MLPRQVSIGVSTRIVLCVHVGQRDHGMANWLASITGEYLSQGAHACVSGTLGRRRPKRIC